MLPLIVCCVRPRTACSTSFMKVCFAECAATQKCIPSLLLANRPTASEVTQPEHFLAVLSGLA